MKKKHHSRAMVIAQLSIKMTQWVTINRHSDYSILYYNRLGELSCSKSAARNCLFKTVKTLAGLLFFLAH
jgi:hypothetical protein